MTRYMKCAASKNIDQNLLVIYISILSADTSRIEVLEEDVSSPVKKPAAPRRKPPKAKYNFDDSDSSEEEDGTADDDFRPNAQGLL